jgi:hypothetical protein
LIVTDAVSEDDPTLSSLIFTLIRADYDSVVSVIWSNVVDVAQEQFPRDWTIVKRSISFCDELRRKYRRYLWDADFQDTLGVTVAADGAYRYAVYRTAEGRRAVVVVNQERDKSIAAAVTIPDAGKLVWATPEDQNTKPAQATLHIQARSALIVMET